MFQFQFHSVPSTKSKSSAREGEELETENSEASKKCLVSLCLRAIFFNISIEQSQSQSHAQSHLIQSQLNSSPKHTHIFYGACGFKKWRKQYNLLNIHNGSHAHTLYFMLFLILQLKCFHITIMIMSRSEFKASFSFLLQSYITVWVYLDYLEI